MTMSIGKHTLCHIPGKNLETARFCTVTHFFTKQPFFWFHMKNEQKIKNREKAMKINGDVWWVGVGCEEVGCTLYLLYYTLHES